MGLRDNLSRLRLAFMQNIFGPILCQFLLVLPALSCGQPVCYLLLTLFQRSHDRSPDILHRDPYEHHEGDELTKHSQIDIHPEITLR